jgi:hypothetical protein
VRLHALELATSNVVDLQTLRLLDTQSAILLLQQCINRRMGYVARVVDNGYAEDALQFFDRSVSRSLAQLVDIGDCPDGLADQISMLRGFSPTTDLWLNASRGTLLAYVDEFYPVLLPTVEGMQQTRLAAYREQMLLLGDAVDEDVDVRTDATTAQSMFRGQRTQFLHWLRQQHRWKEARWLEDCSFPNSARWIKWSGGFNKKHMLWTSPTMKAALRLRLLLPLSNERNAFPHLRCGCGVDLSLDPWHCLDCQFNHQLWVRRHTLVRNCVGGFLRGLGEYTVTPEVPVPGTNKRCDLLLIGPGGRRQYLDISVMNTCGNIAMNAGSGREALRARAMWKLHEYEGHNPEEGAVVPFTLAVTGLMEEETLSYSLQFLTSRNKTKHFLKTKCFAKMSVILTQACAQSLVACVQHATLAA